MSVHKSRLGNSLKYNRIILDLRAPDIEDVSGALSVCIGTALLLYRNGSLIHFTPQTTEKIVCGLLRDKEGYYGEISGV